MTENDGLKREIGVWGLVSNSINIVVGAGIFVLPAIVAEQLGTASVLAYGICGVLIVLMMLCFAEIGSRIIVTGGAYAYIEVAFGRYAGFLTTNIFIFGAAIMANAAVANVLADTLAYFFPRFQNSSDTGTALRDHVCQFCVFEHQGCQERHVSGQVQHRRQIDAAAFHHPFWVAVVLAFEFLLDIHAFANGPRRSVL